MLGMGRGPGDTMLGIGRGLGDTMLGVGYTGYWFDLKSLQRLGDLLLGTSGHPELSSLQRGILLLWMGIGLLLLDHIYPLLPQGQQVWLLKEETHHNTFSGLTQWNLFPIWRKWEFQEKIHPLSRCSGHEKLREPSNKDYQQMCSCSVGRRWSPSH